MDSAPGLHYEICGRSGHHQGLYSGECVSCSNPEYPREKIHLQGLDADRGACCASQAQRDEFTMVGGNDAELVSNLVALIQRATTALVGCF